MYHQWEYRQNHGTKTAEVYSVLYTKGQLFLLSVINCVTTYSLSKVKLHPFPYSSGFARELYPSYGRSFDHTDEQIECDLTIWNPQVRILWRNDARADAPFGTVILYGLSKMSVDFYKNHTISCILHNLRKSKENFFLINNTVGFNLLWKCHLKF